MTEQEIEKLREKLGSEYSVKRLNGAITVELADIWDGVEFASHIFDDEVYRVSEIVGNKIWTTKGTWLSKKVAKPSTESAYVEQLKAKAKELYGEIKDGDRFDYSELYSCVCAETIDPMDEWTYFKYNDSLFTAGEGRGGILIYRQGKWAKKLPQCIVTPVEIYSEEPDIVGDQVISIRMKIIHGDISQKNRTAVAYHLSKCLEDYLNKS